MACGILEKFVGPEHQRVGITLNNLAEVYRAQGRWEDAARIYPQAIAIVEKNLGPDHQTLAGLLENYAVVLRRAHRDTEALEIDERASAIRARHAIPYKIRAARQLWRSGDLTPGGGGGSLRGPR